ncbi:hypothetical protein [Sphaerochaeta sp.]|uniref:hypothetical protein n=1 Tax=Sphaerochaeta sp. TaxID=1972642 RepID=UPI002FCA1BE4
MRSMYLVVLLLLSFGLPAAPLKLTGLSQSYGLYETIVETEERTWSTIFDFTSSIMDFRLGYRDRLPIHDLSLQVDFPFIRPDGSLSPAFVLYMHGSFGKLDAFLYDGVLAYAYRWQLVRRGYELDFSFALGLQESLTFLPLLDEPLQTSSPYYGATLSLATPQGLKLCVLLATNTLFEYSAQAMRPIIQADAIWPLSDSFSIGCYAALRFSDQPPESVIFLSREVSVYALWTNR